MQAETGFVSYIDFLRKHHPSSLITSYASEGRLGSPSFKCSVVDFSRNSNSTDVRGQDFRSHWLHDTNKATWVLEALRQPSATACLRLVLWWSRTPKWLSHQLLDVCGLGLGLEPSFFEAILERVAAPGISELQARQLFQPDGRSYPNHIIAGDYIGTVVYNYVRNRENLPPVLLVVGWGQEREYLKDWISHGVPKPSIWHNTWVSDKVLSPPPCTSAKTNEWDTQMPPTCPQNHTQIYVDCLHHVCRSIGYAELSKEDFIVLSMLPLMHLNTLEINIRTFFLRQSLMGGYADKDHDMQLTKTNRLLLRRYIVESQSSHKSIHKFFQSHNAGHLLSCEGYKEIKELWKDALREAQSIEEEVRDSLQLEASYLSLEESRQSIKLSNHQIEESRRGITPNLPCNSID